MGVPAAGAAIGGVLAAPIASPTPPPRGALAGARPAFATASGGAAITRFFPPVVRPVSDVTGSAAARPAAAVSAGACGHAEPSMDTA